MNAWERVRAAVGLLVGREARFHVSQQPPGWIEELSGRDTAAGVVVSESNALQVSAVWACVRILAETVASLPLHLYRRRADGGKTRAVEHPLYRILHDMPNPEMSSFELRETLMGHLATWGNCYAEIVWTRGGSVAEVWPLRPDRMRVRREDGALWYYYTVRAGEPEQRLPAERVLHVRGLGFDGVVGYSPIYMARQAIGVAMATEEFGARFFANGARPGGILEHPGTLETEAYERLRSSWEAAHGGLSRAHRVAILEEGMKYHEIGLPPEDAQFLQTRTFQVRDIARFYRVPPHMLADLERATFSNIEHQSIEFVVHTIRPWLVRWEQAISRSLLTERERGELFAEFLVDGLLRGDIASRYSAYATGRQNGWLSANDVRAMENMNPIPGGDVYLVPLNMIPADAAGAGIRSAEAVVDGERPALKTPGYEERAAQTRHRLEQAHRQVYVDVLARLLRRERNDVGNAARRLLGRRGAFEFEQWLEEWYAEHGRYVYDQVAPVARAYGELVAAEAQGEVGEPVGMTPELEEWTHSYLAAFAARHGMTSRARIRAALERAEAEGLDPAEAVVEEMEAWPEKRAAVEGQNESVRFGNALAKVIYVAAGIVKLRWRAFDESCPYCSELDGQVVGVNEWFIPAGLEWQPEGAERPLRPQHNIGHAPAHDGCDCMVVAAL